MIRLSQPGSGKVLVVSKEAAEFWKSLGYQEEKKPAAKQQQAKASSKSAS